MFSKIDLVRFPAYQLDYFLQDPLLGKLQLLWEVTMHELVWFANFYNNIIEGLAYGDKEETSDALSYNEDPHGKHSNVEST